MQVGPQSTLEVWSDVACPWCFVGRRNLAIAVADLEPHERPAIVWRAFQIDPLIPVDGVERDVYFRARFGEDLEGFDSMQARITGLGLEVGISFRFDRQRVVPNTNLAHRVIKAGAAHGLYEQIMDALFSAYFEQGVDIGNEQIIRAILEEVDSSSMQDIMGSALTDEEIAEQVKQDMIDARELGVTGVPSFVANRVIVAPGAVPPPVLASMIVEANSRQMS